MAKQTDNVDKRFVQNELIPVTSQKEFDNLAAIHRARSKHDAQAVLDQIDGPVFIVGFGRPKGQQRAVYRFVGASGHPSLLLELVEQVGATLKDVAASAVKPREDEP